jgi:hypothetical protein
LEIVAEPGVEQDLKHQEEDKRQVGLKVISDNSHDHSVSDFIRLAG